MLEKIGIFSGAIVASGLVASDDGDGADLNFIR